MVSKRKQEGVVLVISLVFLIALTAVASVLMQNTTSDMKMSGANQDKMIAIQEAVSAADEVVYKQIEKIDGENKFAKEIAAYDQVVDVNDTNTEASISVVNTNNLEASCAHSRSASSIQVFSCNVLRVEVIKKYGRTNNQNITVNAGISQQLLNVGG